MKHLKFFEAANDLKYDDKFLSSNDYDAHPFYFFKNKGSEDFRFFVGKQGTEHTELLKLIMDNKLHLKETNKNIFKWERGRYWEKEKVIGLWDYPKKEEIRKFINQLEKEAKIKIDDSWLLHVEDELYPDEIKGEIKTKSGKLIPISEFKGSTTDKIRKEQHTLDSKEKEKLRQIALQYQKQLRNIHELPKEEQEKLLQKKAELEEQGVDFSKLSYHKKKDVPLDWKYAMKKEGADSIMFIDDVVSDVYHDDKNVYPFLTFVPTNELVVGPESCDHIVLIGNFVRDTDHFQEEKIHNTLKDVAWEVFEEGKKYCKFVGRIFITQKIISFYDYPNKDELKKIVIGLEEELDIGIWDTFSIEIDWSENNIGELIPLKDYVTSNTEIPNDYRLLHLLPLDVKAKMNKPEGFGSKLNKDKRKGPWNYALTKENIRKFGEK
jgi:hypothetical protein